jgi:acyl dehydratase
VKLLWCLLTVLGLLNGLPAGAVDGASISKVLLHYLDAQGRHTLSPSLYERDAYQDQLRKHPEKVSALRFEVRWTPPAGAGPTLKVRLEVRGEKTAGESLTFELPVQARGRSSQWAHVLMDKAALEKCGGIVAWRARLYHGDGLAAEMKSFLW